MDTGLKKGDRRAKRQSKKKRTKYQLPYHLQEAAKVDHKFVHMKTLQKITETIKLDTG